MKWWESDPTERFWMEVTDRDVLGVDLHQSIRSAAGNLNASWTLASYVLPGDIVFHWQIGKGTVGWSTVAGSMYEEDGTWFIPLQGFKQLPTISVDEWQRATEEVAEIQGRIESSGGTPPHYLPFGLARKPGAIWTMRPPTGSYLKKFPRRMCFVHPALGSLADAADPERSGLVVSPDEVGQEYAEVNEDVKIAEADPIASDPAVIERGNRGHRRTQNQLASHIRSLGLVPLRPKPTDPPFDLAWRRGDMLYIAEIKSCTEKNQEHQLRYGLGQLMRYVHRLRAANGNVIPVLVPETDFPDDWEAVCEAVGVTIVCPPNFEGLAGVKGSS